nr:response regulator [Bifidobacterium catenulatum]
MSDYNLTADGYGMTSALNARTAADAIRQREFDLALLDINLPDGNGFEMCKLIKPQHPDTIVIFLTANDQESDQIRGYEAGAVDYITKPFVIGALQRKVKAMFTMLKHHKPAKDIYDDGRLFGRVAMGLVLSMSGITIALFLVTKQVAVLLTGGAPLLVRPCGDFCTDAGVWKAVVTVYR